MFVLAGVTGKVGSVAARELIAQGKPVRVLVRSAAKAGAWRERAEVVEVALDDQGGLVRALDGAQGFFTLLPGDFAAADFRAEQKRVGATIAAAVAAAKVPHVALLSSIGAEVDGPTGPILGLHWLENALRASGSTLTALRPGYFQENLLGMVPLAREQGIYPSFTAPGYPLPMIATPDIGKEVARVLAAGAAKHNVVDLHGPAYAGTDVAAVLATVLGRPVNAIDIPPEQHVATMTQAGFPEQVARLYAEMHAFFRSGKVALVGDRAVAATTTLEETLRAHLA